MRVATAAESFRSGHAVAHVSLHLDILRCDWLPVTWPAGPGVKFRVRAEKLLAAANANVRALRFCVGVLAGERRFSPLLPRHLELLFRQLRTPFRIVLLDFLAHVHILHPASASAKASPQSSNPAEGLNPCQPAGSGTACFLQSSMYGFVSEIGVIS